VHYTPTDKLPVNASIRIRITLILKVKIRIQRMQIMTSLVTTPVPTSILQSKRIKKQWIWQTHMVPSWFSKASAKNTYSVFYTAEKHV